MKIKALGNKLFVKCDEADEVSDGGIIIGHAADAPQTGTVMFAGPGIFDNNGELIENTVKVGDKIMFVKHNYEQVDVDGETLTIMIEDSVIGIIK